MTVKKIFGFGVKILLALIVLLFLGTQSLNFFNFVFPVEQWYYAYLGFGLTSAAVVGYLVILMTDADTPLRKTISIAMLVVSILGEVVTAGFGMQVEAWKNQGLQLIKSDYNFMILAVQILGFSHGLALVMYFAGDHIIKAFQDDDGDGIPNVIDRHDNRKDKPQPQPKPVPTPTNVPVPALVTNRQEVPQVDLKEPDTNPTNAGKV